MNFDNGHRQRQGQHSKRGRGRNNRRSGGGGGGGSQHGGAPTINRVYESNGPDVKVRGTAQTIAEKYMQLGRDAHSSGDNVMAESYYQFAEHYFRVLQSVQPPGQLAPQILRRPGEETEEEIEVAETDEAGQAGEGGESGVAASADDAEGGVTAEAGQQDGQPRQDRQRDFEGRDNREGGRERFRPRWQQRRNERSPEGQQSQERQPADSDDSQRGAAEQPEAEGNWEAPSFLTRPVPVASPAEAESQGERRPARGRKPRVVAEDPADPISGGE